MKIQEILAWDKDWQEIKDYKAYPMPGVMQHYRDYNATGKYPYLNNVVAYIAEKEGLEAGAEESELHKALKTQVYLASQRVRDEGEIALHHERIAEGYTKITLENWKNLPLGKAELIKKSESILGENVKTIKGRFVEQGFLPIRCRRKGYPYATLVGDYYKVI